MLTRFFIHVKLKSTGLVASFMFFTFIANAQEASFFESVQLDSSLLKKKPAQQWWPASGTLMAAEITPWVVDRYVRNMDYARITWRSTAHNLDPGSWEWDGDGFTTNQFGHPYHGSIFFNAFRSNGYNFWQSSAAAFAGSYLWETFAENQAPAPNDFINTGFGGSVLGELAHRFARRIVSTRKSGFRRHAAEVSALLLNPVSGLKRISNRSWGKNTDRDTTPVQAELDAGLRRFRINASRYHWAPYGRVRFSYGDPFRQSKQPFDHFGILVELGHDDSAVVNAVHIFGTLRNWQINPAIRHSKHAVQLTANYDYIHNNAFFYSSQSLRANLISSFQGPKMEVVTQAGGGLILLAAVPDPVEYKGRYYSYCMGVGYNAAVMLKLSHSLMAGIHYRGGYLRTVNGSAKDYFLHAFSGEVRLRLLPGLFFCTEPGHFSLTGRYAHLPEIQRVYPYIRTSLRWDFTIR